MRGVVILLSVLALGWAQSPEERLPGVIDDLYDKFDKASPTQVTLLELNDYFSRWDTGDIGWELDEDKFVAGWKVDFGHDDDESAAYFRMFDWVGEENCTVDYFDLEALVFRIGHQGIVTEEAFKTFLRIYYQGVGFAVTFNFYRTKGTGRYDDFISSDDWLDRMADDADTDGDEMVSQDEFRAWFSPKYGTIGVADSAHAIADRDNDGQISDLEWTVQFLALKDSVRYPPVDQLHFEEWMQYEQQAMGTPRP